MKKLIGILLPLLIMMVFTFSSCEKDDGELVSEISYHVSYHPSTSVEAYLYVGEGSNMVANCSGNPNGLYDYYLTDDQIELINENGTKMKCVDESFISNGIMNIKQFYVMIDGKLYDLLAG